MVAIPSFVTAKELRKELGSVATFALDRDSPAYRVADEARRAANDRAGVGDSYLRGKAEFEAAHRLLEELDGDDDQAQVRLKLDNGELTEAGKIVQAWLKASSDRADLFDGMGLNKQPSILRINVDNIDLTDFWKTDRHGDPKISYAGPTTRVSIFETKPHLKHVKLPDEANGLLIYSEGEGSVSLRRRGNMSVNDAKPQLSVYVDKDKEGGIPNQIKLINAIRDPSYQRVHLAWDLLEKARVPVQPHTFAEVNVNNKHYGTYVAIPPMDRAHFDKVFKPEKGEEEAAIFKANWMDMGPATLRHIPGEDDSGRQYFKAGTPENKRTYEPESDTPEADYKYLAKFIAVLNGVDLPGGAQRFNTKAFRTSMEKIMDVYTFLRTAAMFNLMGSWDTYYRTPSNYYLHISKKKNAEGGIDPYVRFHPYDLDNTFGTSWPNQQRKWHEKSIFFGKAGGHRPDPEVGDIRLVEVLLRNDDFRAYYVDFMSWMVDKHFKPELVRETGKKLWDEVLQHSVYLESDSEHGDSHTARPWTNRQVYEAGGLGWESWGFGGQYKVEGPEHFVRMRRENVLQQLGRQQVGRSGVDFESKNWTPNWP